MVVELDLPTPFGRYGGAGAARSQPATQITAIIVRVSVSKKGAIRDHCASENQKKSSISNASSPEALNHPCHRWGMPFMGPDLRLWNKASRILRLRCPLYRKN